METKEKKGFWASLFSSKPCKCSRKADGVMPSATTASMSDVKEIKVLGPGCAKCKATYAVVEKVVHASGLDVKLTKVEDIEELMRYNIMATPAVIVDGKVVIKGKIPAESEVRQILGI